MVPHRFVDGSNLDMEKVNDNLEAGARDVNRNLSKRYTYSTLVWDIAGLTDASAAVLRTFAIRRPGTNNAVEVCGIELVIYTSVAVTWTVTCSNSAWAPLELATTASATTESYAARLASVAVPSSSSDVTFALSASGASTITSGYLVVHLRCDRGDQGSAHTGYTPTLIDSSTSTAGSVLDTQLTNLATSVTADTNNATDLRCECFVVRQVALSTPIVFRTPSGARRIHSATMYVVDAGAGSAQLDLAGDITAMTLQVAAAGATTLAVGSVVAGADATQSDAPMTPTDDLTITLSETAALTWDAITVLVWWS